MATGHFSVSLSSDDKSNGSWSGREKALGVNVDFVVSVGSCHLGSGI